MKGPERRARHLWEQAAGWWSRGRAPAHGPARSRLRSFLGTGRRRVVVIVALVLAALVVPAAVAGAALMFRLDGNLSTFDERGLTTGRPQPIHRDGSGRAPVNVLMIGSDSRARGNQKLGGGTGDVGRSDTAILVHVAADHEHAVAVSIPRDTLVDIPPCRLPDGNWSPPRRQTMFNDAFGLGRTASGNPACTQNTVEKLTGLRVDHTVVVDFEGFAAITKAVGGVRVCVPENVYEADVNPSLDRRGDLVFAKGLQTVSGAKALDYVRVRHGIGDGSDLGRIKRQQAFLAGLATQVRAAGINPATLVPLADAATRSMTVDSGLDSTRKLVAFGMSMRRIRLEGITFVTVPWRPAGDRVVVDRPAADRLWAALKADRPLDRAGPHDSRAAPSRTLSPGPTPSNTPQPEAGPRERTAADNPCSDLTSNR